MKKLTAVLFILAMLAGCTSMPPERIPIPHQEAYTYDQNTRFAIKEESDGFFLTVDYARHPRSSDWGGPAGLLHTVNKNRFINKECKSQFTAIARDLSDKTGRKIRPINEESINVDMWEVGYWACQAQGKVEWE